MVEDPLSEKLLYKEFSAGQIIVVDAVDDPDKPGQQHIVFSAVEGFVPPSSVELATTSSIPDGGSVVPIVDEAAGAPAPDGD